ncbi:MAG: VWA domain-containing protein [Clostridiales bacterium]|nr:VWA domain-containing protein [Clostridiales bacterium]
MRFANGWFLLLIPAFFYLFWATRKKRGLAFSSIRLLQRTGRTSTIKHKIGKALVLCGVVLTATALARPQTTEITDFIQQQGIDIAMLLDVSGSMQSVDFEPNRLEVARKTIDDFIAERVSDRISLVIFAGSAYTRIPLTLDHEVLRASLAEVSIASVNLDGTAIGMAISVGLNRLKKSDAASRVMILATDGENNAGAIDPVTASNLARELGIRIYTIGIGSDTLILPSQNIFGQTQYLQYEGGFDEALLKRIAETTGGQYFRAMDAKALEQVFDTINALEKTEFNEDNYREYHELAFPFIMAALLLLSAGVILDKYHYVQIP